MNVGTVDVGESSAVSQSIEPLEQREIDRTVADDNDWTGCGREGKYQAEEEWWY